MVGGRAVQLRDSHGRREAQARGPAGAGEELEDDVTDESTMSLEKFEEKRKRGKWGANQHWLRDLAPLTPTEFPVGEKGPQVAQSSIRSSWRGAQGRDGSPTPLSEEMGGDLRTSAIDGKVWVVWYPPADSNGA